MPPNVQVEGGGVRERVPLPSRGVLSDLWLYVLRRPDEATLVEAESPVRREELGRRILQRLGVDVTRYGVLNLHRIGVEAPARCIFEELQRWEVTRSCWPHHLVALERVNGQVDCMRAYLLGRRDSLFGLRNGFLGLEFTPLFQFDLLELVERPGPLDLDNTRFLLWACSGGYPIGIFSVVVRSSLATLGEREQSQVFFLVSFDFWGKRSIWGLRIVRPVWEWIHNRVTGNILNRFKALCLARFRELATNVSATGAEGGTPPPA